MQHLPDYVHEPQALAGQTIHCSCGLTHTIHTQKIVLAPGAIHQSLESGLSGTPLIIADTHTWAYAPASFHSLPHYILSHDPILADEYTLGDLLIEASVQSVDYLIALGSGTIGDSVRFLASTLHKPFVNICTAPSMDGAASQHSPLIHHQFKTTYPAAAPYAIYFDLDIMAAAPAHMLAAGLADIEGKHVATLDWYIGHLVTGEAYCEPIRDLTMASVALCEQYCDGLAAREPQAVRALATSLLLTSLAMQLNVTSRPASGMEHLISHAWENYAIRQGLSPHLHGDKVGLGTLIACDVYHAFFHTVKMPQQERYAPLVRHWNELTEKADALYALKPLIRERIAKAGGPVTLSALGISRQAAVYGFQHMTDGRPRVTIAHLIKELQLEEVIYPSVLESIL